MGYQSYTGVLPSALIRLGNLRCEVVNVLARTEEQMMMLLMMMIYLRIHTSGLLCEHDSEPSTLIKMLENF